MEATAGEAFVLDRVVEFDKARAPGDFVDKLRDGEGGRDEVAIVERGSIDSSVELHQVVVPLVDIEKATECVEARVGSLGLMSYAQSFPHANRAVADGLACGIVASEVLMLIGVDGLDNETGRPVGVGVPQILSGASGRWASIRPYDESPIVLRLEKPTRVEISR